MSNLYEAWTNKKPLTDARARAFVEYATKYQKYLIPIGNFIFDGLSLRSKMCMSHCLYCSRYQDHDCCTDQSYSMPKENADRLEPHIADILKSIPPDQNDVQRRLESYYKYGAITPRLATATRGHEDHHCIFSIKEGDMTKCAIHRWCLEHDLNPIAYKPYTCSTFPIDGIELPNGKIFIFFPTKETTNFTMHYHTYTCKVCLNEENMLRALSGNVGQSSYLRSVKVDNIREDGIYPRDFHPAYVEHETTLRYFVGDDVYEEFVKRMENLLNE